MKRLIARLRGTNGPVAYEHTPLPPSEHFRLLSLQAGLGDEPLRCNLMTTPLSGKRFFGVISASWGPDESDQTIRCNRRGLAITSDMRDALLALRDEEQSRLLRIIGVCVNQTDLKEKAQQNELILEIQRRHVACFSMEDLNLSTVSEELARGRETIMALSRGSLRTWASLCCSWSCICGGA